MDMFHDQHVSHKWHMFVILYYFLCPAQSLLWVYLVWVHSHCGLEILLLFSISLGVEI